MSDAAPQITLSAESEPQPLRAPAVTRTRRLLGAFASALFPGTGQILIGEWPKAIVLLALFAMLVTAFWPLRMLRYYVGYIVLVLSALSLYICAASSAQLSGSPTGVRASRWWLLLIIPLSFLGACLFFAVILRISGFRSLENPSTSMEPTIRQKDVFMVDARSRVSVPRKIVVFSKNGILHVKRVIAIDGETIQGRGGSIFVNGAEQYEPYVEHIGTPPQWMIDFGPIRVPQGKSFVMGDNRDVSLDSRSPEFGLVDNNSIVGQPLYVMRSKHEGSGIK